MNDNWLYYWYAGRRGITRIAGDQRSVALCGNAFKGSFELLDKENSSDLLGISSCLQSDIIGKVFDEPVK